MIKNWKTENIKEEERKSSAMKSKKTVYNVEDEGRRKSALKMSMT